MLTFSEIQQERFIIHLADCHGWHKHLSLCRGGQFIITHDITAGQNYPTQHPALPFGNDYEGYQRAFGQLICFWKNYDEDTFFSDALVSGFTDAELKNKYRFAYEIVLFPYLSSDFIEAINFFKEDFESICQGKEHEEKLNLSRVYNLHCRKEYYWQAVLTEKDRESVASDSKENSSTNIQEYLSIEEELKILLNELRLKEIKKIKDAIDKLNFSLNKNNFGYA